MTNNEPKINKAINKGASQNFLLATINLKNCDKNSIC